MIPARTRIRRAALSGMFHSRLHRLLERASRGIGALFTLHHVRPSAPRGRFAPNRILEITPDFLDETIQLVVRLGYEAVSLGECRRRIVERDFRRPFVSFTLDDGYADNYVHAFPVFAEHRVPFAIYLCTGLLDGSVRPWWRDLEEIVARNGRLEMEMKGRGRELTCASDDQKRRVFDMIYWALKDMPHDRQTSVLEDLVRRYRPPDSALPAMLSREMIEEMEDSGLLTIGAHTLTHPALSKLSRGALLEEMERSRDRIREWLGVAPSHFSYPYGDEKSAGRREFEAARELGFMTGVTTRKGVLHPEHADFLHALPRVSLNGDYQQPHYVELFLTGVPFALHPGLPRINVD